MWQLLLFLLMLVGLIFGLLIWLSQLRGSIWRKLMLGALSILVLSLLVQLLLFVNKNYLHTLRLQRVTTADKVLTLNVLYPETVVFDTTDTDVTPVLFWLESLPPAVTAVTYTVIITPVDQGVTIVNVDGQLIPPRFSLSYNASSSTTFYLRRAADGTLGTSQLIVILQPYAADTITPLLQMPLTIRLEPIWLAALRQTAATYLGSVTSMLAIVAALGSLALQKWTEEHDKVKEALSRLARVRLEITTHLIKALEEWVELDQNATHDPDWNFREVREELEKIWEVISQQKWQQTALLHVASSGINSPALLDLVQRRTTEKKIEVTVAIYLKHHQDIDVAVTEIGSVEGILQAMLWLFKSLKQVQPFLIESLCQILGKASFIGAVEEILASDPDGRRLLNEKVFTDPLQALETAESTRAETKRAVRRLLRLRSVPYHYPQLYRTEANQETWAITRWREQMNLAFNPFFPERAEFDKRLPTYWIPPVGFEELTEPTALLVYGEVGSGKTAAALAIVDRCINPLATPNPTQRFPIYSALHVNSWLTLSPKSPCAYVAQIIGEAITRFIAVNPYAFIELSLEKQEAQFLCMMQTVQTVDELKIRLRQFGLLDNGAGQQLLEVLDKNYIIINLRHVLDETWLEIFKNARPPGAQQTFLLLDIHSAEIRNQDLTELAQRLQGLLLVASRLSDVSVYMKLFIPDRLWSVLSNITEIDLPQLSLHWTGETLRNLLEDRLHKAGRDEDINVLFVANARPANPAKLFVEAAKTPRELLQLGSRLLLHHTKQHPTTGEFTYEELENAISAGKTS